MLAWTKTPAFLLLILPPIFAEIISGATPLLMILNPVVVILFVGFYGCGALLIRELTFRWQKGWPTILLLGAAFAMVEEGLMTKVFFNPESGISPLVNYGRVFDINWPLMLQLIPYHTIISIAVPIFLTGYIFADKRGEIWVSDGKIKLLAIIFILSFVATSALFFSYSPAPLSYLAVALAAIISFFRAKELPSVIRVSPKPLPSRVKLVLLGLAFTSIILGAAFILPGFNLTPVATSLVYVALMFFGVRLLAGWASNGAWSDRDQLALVTGVTLGLLLFNVVLVIFGRLEMIISITVTSAMLLWLWKKQRLYLEK